MDTRVALKAAVSAQSSSALIGNRPSAKPRALSGSPLMKSENSSTLRGSRRRTSARANRSASLV
jgi:hypothetical protein